MNPVETSKVKALDVVNLAKQYGSVLALNKLSLQIESGEIFGLLGPNGAGKTSLISILTTLEEPTSGSAKIFGYNVQTESARTKPILGVVPQEIVSHGFFDIVEVLKFQSGYYGIRDNKAHIEYLLKKLSLWDHREKRVKQLSGGMKRRLMIAKALVHKPKLLLLDEPTAGVDIELREQLWFFVRELRNEGMTILLTTHYLQEAENLCDRVAVINKGEIHCLKPTKELIAELSRREIFISLKKEHRFEKQFLEQNQFIKNYLVTKEETQFRFLVPAQVQIGELLSSLQIASENILDLQVKEGGLEEAMKFVLKKGSVV